MLKKSTYKYFIKQQLDEMPPKQRHIAIARMARSLNVTTHSIRRYMRARISSSTSVTAEDLHTIAKILNITTSDLINPAILCTNVQKLQQKSNNNNFSHPSQG